MNEVTITIIILIITLFGIHINEQIRIEPFGKIIASIPKLFKAMINFFVNFVDLFMVLVDAVINFALNIVDLFFALLEAVQWIGQILPSIGNFIIWLVNAFLDLLVMFTIWLNPVSLVRSVVRTMVFFCKMILLMIIDIFIQVYRIVLEQILSAFRGGMWGIPHEPKHHLKHVGAGLISEDEGGYYHHHEHDNNINYHKYRNMRCYKTMTSNGYLNIIGTIICPPLGVFMSFGLSGFFKILICAALTLFYYVPGLVYALLITSHLGLGLQLDVKDCGGYIGGLTVYGCENRKTKGLCEDAAIPDRRAKDGTIIPACKWEEDDKNEYGGKCADTQITGDNYTAMIDGKWDKKTNNVQEYDKQTTGEVLSITGDFKK
jgi:uncharacterized membrane protein YqaE (UPF0057 family)